MGDLLAWSIALPDSSFASAHPVVPHIAVINIVVNFCSVSPAEEKSGVQCFLELVIRKLRQKHGFHF